MKNMVAPTFRSARAELKLSATTRHQHGEKPLSFQFSVPLCLCGEKFGGLPSRSVCLHLGFAKKGVHGAL